MEPLTFLAPPSPCEYLSDRLSQLRYEFAPEITREEYMERLRTGWRRFGPAIFRPECPSCQMCQSLRVPVATFTPTESQRRAWRRNEGEIRIEVGEPSWSREKLDLWRRFHRHGTETKGWPIENHDLSLFIDNPFPTEEWSYYLGERLIGVGYVDALPEGLSAIYFFWNPEEGRRSLGTFNILAMIEAAKERGLPHVYLGYFVEGCRSLEYKGRFGPSEVLANGGEWKAFVE